MKKISKPIICLSCLTLLSGCSTVLYKTPKNQVSAEEFNVEVLKATTDSNILKASISLTLTDDYVATVKIDSKAESYNGTSIFNRYNKESTTSKVNYTVKYSYANEVISITNNKTDVTKDASNNITNKVTQSKSVQSDGDYVATVDKKNKTYTTTIGNVDVLRNYALTLLTSFIGYTSFPNTATDYKYYIDDGNRFSIESSDYAVSDKTCNEKYQLTVSENEILLVKEEKETKTKGDYNYKSTVKTMVTIRFKKQTINKTNLSGYHKTN